MHRLIILAIALTLSLTSFAQVVDNRTKLGAQLAQLLDYTSQWQSYATECAKSEGTAFDPDKLYQSNPTAFGGISPKSAYWPRIRAIYRDYQLTLCDAIGSKELDELVAKELASSMSESDLNAAISFYTSPAGRGLNLANAHVNEVARRHLTQSIGSYSSPNYVAVTKALMEVVQEFQRTPK